MIEYIFPVSKSSGGKEVLPVPLTLFLRVVKREGVMILDQVTNRYRQGFATFSVRVFRDRVQTLVLELPPLLRSVRFAVGDSDKDEVTESLFESGMRWVFLL